MLGLQLVLLLIGQIDTELPKCKKIRNPIVKSRLPSFFRTCDSTQRKSTPPISTHTYWKTSHFSTHSCRSDRFGTQHVWSLAWFFLRAFYLSFFLKKDWDTETLTPRQRNWVTYALLKVHLPKQGQHQSFFKVPLTTHIRCSGINPLIPLVLGHLFSGSHLGDERILGAAVLQASLCKTLGGWGWLHLCPGCESHILRQDHQG